MRLFVLLFLLIFSIRSFAQKDSLGTIPAFYKIDPRIYVKGKMEIPVSLLKTTPSFGNLIPVKIIDTSGQNVFRIGFVDKKGRFIIPPELLGYGKISGRFMVIFKQSGAGIINDEGNTVLDAKYKSIEFVNDNTVRVKNFTTWQVRNELNLIKAEYTADSLYSEGQSIYQPFINGAINGSYSFPENDRKENKRKDFQRKDSDQTNYFKFIKYKNKTGVENLECNIIIPPVYDSIHYIHSDSIFIVYWKKMIAIMDKDGSEFLPLTEKFQKIFTFNDGRARMLRNGKYGFIDRIGNIHISPQYPSAYDFSENVAAVMIAGKWAFVDKEENIVVQPFYQEVRNFQYGTARVKEKNKWFFINKEGKKITAAPYDEIMPAKYKRWILVSKNKYGLADSTGNEMLAPNYEMLEDLNNGYFIVKKLNKWGVLDYKQNFVIPIEFDAMDYDKGNKYFLAGTMGKEELIPLVPGKKKGKER
jgi:hypothetical protein